MNTWSDDDLRRIGNATELQLAPRRSDGNLQSFTTMWVVRVDNDLYVRSAGGAARPWYRHALATGNGRIRARGIETDIVFDEAPADVQVAIDDAYHAKYDRYGAGPVGHVTGQDAHGVTVRLVRSAP